MSIESACYFRVNNDPSEPQDRGAHSITLRFANCSLLLSGGPCIISSGKYCSAAEQGR